MDTTRKYRKVKNGKTTGYMKYVEHFEEWVVYNMRSEKAKHYTGILTKPIQRFGK